jgi:hypothetical protein
MTQFGFASIWRMLTIFGRGWAPEWWPLQIRFMRESHKPQGSSAKRPAEIEPIDQWIAKQKPEPSRPEAIRRLVELGLKVKSK